MSDVYRRPKVRLHREFLFLNHDAVINSLSALEAGKVDEIIEKSVEGGEGGLEAGVTAGPVKAGGSKKKQSSIQAELTRKRTKFSAFQAWYEYLHSREAIGRLNGWNETVRGELAVGDTIECEADVRLAKIGFLFAAFSSYVEEAGKPGSPMHLPTGELNEARKIAKMMQGWMTGSWPVHIAPLGVDAPMVVARLEEDYLVGPLDRVEGRYTIVGQVDSMLTGDERVSVMRALTGSPPTKAELDITVEALTPFAEPADALLGTTLVEDDIIYRAPTVVMRPLAIFR